MELDEKKKKKPYNSMSITTGDIDYNIRQFNKRMGTAFPGNDNNNPSTEEAKANAAAEAACKATNTVIAASPDGGTSVSNSTDGGTSAASSGEGAAGVGESLEINEAKRYVRRYYVKPQNVFCSNKAEVLKALIDYEDQDLIVYTLINLGDTKDVGKLTPNDVIYYYEDGILYDKNHVRIMDYDLYIKHEEERKKFAAPIEQVSDAAFAAEYEDRMTDATNTKEARESLEEEFNLTFEDYNVYGEKLTEAKEEVCCICGEPLEGYGNNPEPYKHEGRCCDACNLKFVIPARLDDLNKEGK